MLADPMIGSMICGECPEQHKGGCAESPLFGSVIDEYLIPTAEDNTTMSTQIGLWRLGCEPMQVMGCDRQHVCARPGGSAERSKMTIQASGATRVGLPDETYHYSGTAVPQ